MFRWLLRTGAVVGILVVLGPAVRHGWTHVETDFPNYYTAAVLARKHAPLRKFYDWTWFQRQMNYAGWEHQLGGYIPHSPLTMLPILPLSWLAPMTAKQVWLAANVLFLFAAMGILANLSTLPASGLILLAAAGYQALSLNFILGQYYVFILLLLAASFWLLLRRREFSAGVLLGAVFVLKLYAGPFLIYFAWKRQWRAVAGMLSACFALGLLSIGLYGLRDNSYYVISVLPRALAGESTDPYAPGLATVSNMLRHAFVFEPDLNPHPVSNVPAVAFFLQALVTFAAPVLCLLLMPRSRGDGQRHELAWFLVMLLFVSPSRVQYMGVMLLAAVALLWDKGGKRERIALLATYVLLTIPMPRAASEFFPSVWILLAAYIALGGPYLRGLSLRPATTGIVAAALLCAAGWSAYRRMASVRIEPSATLERVASQPGAIYSASPAVSRTGIVYESIGHERYELQRWSPTGQETYNFPGEAFHPSVSSLGDAIYFELVAGGHSQLMSFDPASKELNRVVSQGFEPTNPAASPDNEMLAFLAGTQIVIYKNGSSGAIIDPRPVHDLNWFPDSARLIYSAGPLGGSQIYATQPPNSPPVQLTDDSGDHTEPAVSPDGLWFAYTRDLGGTRQVWLRDFVSRNAKQITRGNCNSYSPAWEPDSRGLIFASDCERGEGLPALYRWRLDSRFPQVR